MTLDPWKDTDAFVSAACADGTVPGAALVAARDGRVRHRRVWGTYCGLRGRALPLTPDVRHPLYSFSKLVTATVLARLRDEGLLDWDTPVAAWLPEFAGGGKDPITLRHCLTHAAGIPTVPLGGARTEAEWDTGWKSLCAARTEWEPGSRTAYHALSGQFVAARVARHVCGGAPWETICRGRLFDPLGAATLTFAIPDDDLPVAITPQPKDAIPKRLFDAFGMGGQPGGGCVGTVDDALKVVQLHVDRGRLPGGRRWLSGAVWTELHTLQWGAEIRRARAEGRAPTHESWGLGPLLRGDGPREGGHGWFGFGSQDAPTVFGHAGIDTVIGVGEPRSRRALFFVTTHSPQPAERTVLLRGGVADRVFAALG